MATTQNGTDQQRNDMASEPIRGDMAGPARSINGRPIYANGGLI